jgi:hypothetical protein
VGRRLRQEFPDRVLIASIMEEYNKGAWEEIIGRWAGERTTAAGWIANWAQGAPSSAHRSALWPRGRSRGALLSDCVHHMRRCEEIGVNAFEINTKAVLVPAARDIEGP